MRSMEIIDRRDERARDGIGWTDCYTGGRRRKTLSVSFTDCQRSGLGST